MLGSVRNDGELDTLVTAGILVEKGASQRLTCSYHCWENLHKEHPNAFGSTKTESQDIFQARQGDDLGTTVGFVRERLGETDIALAQLKNDTIFENAFIEMPYRPRTLLHSDLVNVGDDFVVDSFVTGKQKLRNLGKRFQFGRRRGQPNPDIVDVGGPLPTEGARYIAAEQGVSATNDAFMTKKPYIRAGICGAVLLRCKNVKQRALTEPEVMELGEVAGMVHFCDLQLKKCGTPYNYFVYSDSFDPLIDDGWKVA
jgi:hypothetical protein